MFFTILWNVGTLRTFEKINLSPQASFSLKVAFSAFSRPFVIY
jgi:hypothetical protein